MSNHPDGTPRGIGIEGLSWEPLLAHTSSLSSMRLMAGPIENNGGAEPKTPLAQAGVPIPSSPESNVRGKFTMARKKEKMEMPICTRVSVSTFRALEVWCDNSFRKRSEVVGIVLERVVEILSQQQCIEQPVEEFVRRLRVAPNP
jgi:hypothetical protein